MSVSYNSKQIVYGCKFSRVKFFFSDFIEFWPSANILTSENFNFSKATLIGVVLRESKKYPQNFLWALIRKNFIP